MHDPGAAAFLSLCHHPMHGAAERAAAAYRWLSRPLQVRTQSQGHREHIPGVGTAPSSGQGYAFVTPPGLPLQDRVTLSSHPQACLSRTGLRVRHTPRLASP
eukprot:5091463-Pyramimonas_sp.AAC.1